MEIKVGDRVTSQYWPDGEYFTVTAVGERSVLGFESWDVPQEKANLIDLFDKILED